MKRDPREVYVYRNLNQTKKDGCPVYSVMKNGRVIKHVHRILLMGARFVVRPAGRARVVREKKKNVHAFVVGIDAGSKGAFGIDKDDKRGLPVKVTYNPYAAPTFQRHDGIQSNPVHSARGVLLNERGITACYLD